MKLKKIAAKLLAAVMIVTSLPVGLSGAGQQVFADPADDAANAVSEDDELWTNIAVGKTVATTGTDGVNLGANAVDGSESTFWTSRSIATNGAQSLTIDLGAKMTSISVIKVLFAGKAWSPNYTIETRSSAKSTWKTINTITETDADKTDYEQRIERNAAQEKIVASRYLRFTFTSLSTHAGAGVTGVSVAEIQLLGVEDGVVYGPDVELTDPVSGQYPEPAVVKADMEHGKRHTTVADRTWPAATLYEALTGSMKEGANPPVRENGTLLSEKNNNIKVLPKDGTFGFNTLAQTPGVRNKFDIFGTDLNIISFQLYMPAKPTQTGSEPDGECYLFGKGEKYYLQADRDKLSLTMHAQNGWAEEQYKFDNTNSSYNADTFFTKWHDILVVIDGKGSMRLYVDGNPAVSKNNVSAIPGENTSALAPFALGGQMSNDATEMTKKMQKEDGTPRAYIARLKFYTNKEFDGMLNGAGLDISGAQTVSDQFDNFSITEIENATKGEGSASHNKNAYYAITNMLQKEQPTVRITLCPYSRSTVWSKYDVSGEAASWKPMEATEAFGANTIKYKATTTLAADEGFVFDESSREKVLASLETSTPDAKSTAILSNKNRILTIVSYFNCSDADMADKDIVEERCGIESVEFADDEMEVTKGASGLSVPEPIVQKHFCPEHASGKVKISYRVKEGDDYIEVNETTGALTVKQFIASNKFGDIRATVEATAALLDSSDNSITDGTDPIKSTAEIDIIVNEAETIIDTPPAITMVSPVKGQYPQVAEIRRQADSPHHNNIADRMQPAATFVSVTDPQVKTENQLPDNQTIPDPVIEYIDGRWAFNAQGQTIGTDNKFDVGGHDVKVISFKAYFAQKPKAGDANRMSLFGKGNKYSIQIDSNKLFLFANVEGGQWAEEAYYFDKTQNPNYTSDAEFFGKWHDMFVVVDGKGKQRLYVDGNPSKTTKDYPAYALEVPAGGKKPFSFGCNLGDNANNTPNWWTLKFTKEYGYLADFEFYTDKDYTGVINAAGDSVEDAAVISTELAEDIDIVELERNHSGNLNAVITNLLQQSNPAVNISVNPYTAKTIWRQQKAGTTDEYEEPKPMEKFGASSVYQSEVILTAHKGFKFSNENEFKEKVKAGFKATSDLLVADSVKVFVEADNQGNAQKVLRITADYAETAEADCTCGIAGITTPSPVSVVIPEGADAGVQNVTPMAPEAVKLAACEKKGHPVAVDGTNARIHFTYEVADDASKEALELTKEGDELKSVKAKKAGDFKIRVKAEYQTKSGSDWTTVTNDAGNKAESTVDLVVNVRRADSADEGAQDTLKGLADGAKTQYPSGEAGDYDSAAWSRLQEAIANAVTMSNKNNPNITAGQVAQAKSELEAAVSAMAGKKNAQGIARDDLKKALADLEEAYNNNNKDKKYTDESWKAFTGAYESAAEQVATAAESALKLLKADLESKYNGLVFEKTTPPDGGDAGSTVKDGQVLSGSDGSSYQVASAKDKTVVITKGVDAKKITVGPNVTIKGEIYKVIGIGNNAFKGLKSATTVTINANVASIGDQAFANSKKLKNVTIGANVTKIGKKAFFKCPKLNKVTLKGKGLTKKSIGKQAFAKTAKKAKVRWGSVKGKQRTQLKKALKKAGLKVK